MVILTIFFAIVIATGKGVADIVSSFDEWNLSIFSKFDAYGFWGNKDYTWPRKYRKNKILNYLFSNWLVFTTDLWHFANFVQKIGWYGSIVCVLFSTNPWLALILHVITNLAVFHLMYHYLLRKD